MNRSVRSLSLRLQPWTLKRLTAHAVALAAATAVTVPAAAQSAVPADASRLRLEPSLRLATAYEGRGLTFHEGLAAQLTLDVARSGTAGELRAGAWTNVELLRDPGEPTMLAEAAPGMSEVNLYVSATQSLGAASVTGGWIYFLWPTGFDFSDAGPLHELYLGLATPLPLLTGASLAATAYYDFAARGTYAELTAGAPLGAFLGVRPDLGITVAGVVGQEEYYHRGDGVTHVTLALGVEQPGRWTVLRPELRWTVAIDPATRVGALDDERRHKLHLGLRVAPR